MISLYLLVISGVPLPAIQYSLLCTFLGLNLRFTFYLFYLIVITLVIIINIQECMHIFIIESKGDKFIVSK